MDYAQTFGTVYVHHRDGKTLGPFGSFGPFQPGDSFCPPQPFSFAALAVVSMVPPVKDGELTSNAAARAWPCWPIVPPKSRLPNRASGAISRKATRPDGHGRRKLSLSKPF